MIYINNISSFRDPESYKVVPDDRIQKIEIIDSIAIQDYGHIADGDTIQLTCLFSQRNFNQLTALWESRANVTFRDMVGRTLTNRLIVIKEYGPDKDFPEYMLVTFELWKNKLIGG